MGVGRNLITAACGATVSIAKSAALFVHQGEGGAPKASSRLDMMTLHSWVIGRISKGCSTSPTSRCR